MAAPSTTSVLRIGPTEHNASAALLKTALLSHFSDNDQDNTTLTVSNRYFTAKVALKDLNNDNTTAVEKEDGIILVFDLLQSNPDIVGKASSFDALTLAHSQAEESNQCGELLRLCVGVHVGEMSPSQLRGKDYEKEYSRRVLWCLDRGYEYVEVNLSKQAQQSGHDERDKEGFARVVEAISGTVWSCAVMEKKQQQELKQSYQTTRENLQKEEETENPYIPPDPTLLDDKIQASLVNQKEEDDDNYFIDDSQQESSEQERAMESLEGLLREASRIREASKAGEMSDDERRQRASDAAVLMMNLMNQLNVDEEQEDDFEVDSSSDEETATSS